MRPTGEPAARALRVPGVLLAPRAAGVAGIVFGLLLATVIILIHVAVPAQPSDVTGWLTNSSRWQILRVIFGLLPFAVISFLWFMGVIRDYVGEAEDKFFATIALGSGLLFLASLLVVIAAVGGLLATTELPQTAAQSAAAQSELWQFVRYFTSNLLSACSMRMAAVFAISTSTIGQRLGIFPGWLVWLGYCAALVLLFLVGIVAWSELTFPVWVLLVSGHILHSNLNSRHER